MKPRTIRPLNDAEAINRLARSLNLTEEEKNIFIDYLGQADLALGRPEFFNFERINVEGAKRISRNFEKDIEVIKSHLFPADVTKVNATALMKGVVVDDKKADAPVKLLNRASKPGISGALANMAFGSDTSKVTTFESNMRALNQYIKLVRAVPDLKNTLTPEDKERFLNRIKRGDLHPKEIDDQINALKTKTNLKEALVTFWEKSNEAGQPVLSETIERQFAADLKEESDKKLADERKAELEKLNAERKDNLEKLAQSAQAAKNNHAMYTAASSTTKALVDNLVETTSAAIRTKFADAKETPPASLNDNIRTLLTETANFTRETKLGSEIKALFPYLLDTDTALILNLVQQTKQQLRTDNNNAIDTELGKIRVGFTFTPEEEKRYSQPFRDNVNRIAPDFYNRIKSLLKTELEKTRFEAKSLTGIQNGIDGLFRAALTKNLDDKAVAAAIPLLPTPDIRAELVRGLQTMHSNATSDAAAVERQKREAEYKANLGNLTNLVRIQFNANPSHARVADTINRALGIKFNDITKTLPKETEFKSAVTSLHAALSNLDKKPDLAEINSAAAALGLSDNAEQIRIAFLTAHRAQVLEAVSAGMSAEQKAIWPSLETAILAVDPEKHDKTAKELKEGFQRLFSGDPNKPTADDIKALYHSSLDAKQVEPVAQRIKDANRNENNAKVDALLNSVTEFNCQLAEEKIHSDEFKKAVNDAAKKLYDPWLKSVFKAQLSKNKLDGEIKSSPLFKTQIEALVSSAINNAKKPTGQAFHDHLAPALAPTALVPPGALDTLTQLHQTAAVDRMLMKVEREIQKSPSFDSKETPFNGTYTLANYQAEVMTAWKKFKTEFIKLYNAKPSDLDEKLHGNAIATTVVAMLTKRPDPLDPKMAEPLFMDGTLNDMKPAVLQLLADLNAPNKAAAASIVIGNERKNTTITAIMAALPAALEKAFAAELKSDPSNFAQFKEKLDALTKDHLTTLLTNEYRIRAEVDEKAAATEATSIANQLKTFFSKPPVKDISALILDRAGDVPSAVAALNNLQAEQAVAKLKHALLADPSAPEFKGTTPTSPELTAAYVKQIEKILLDKNLHQAFVTSAKSAPINTAIAVDIIKKAKTDNSIKDAEIKASFTAPPFSGMSADQQSALAKSIADANLALYTGRISAQMQPIMFEPDPKNRPGEKDDVLSFLTADLEKSKRTIEEIERALPRIALPGESKEWENARVAAQKLQVIINTLQPEVNKLAAIKNDFEKTIENLKRDREKSKYDDALTSAPKKFQEQGIETLKWLAAQTPNPLEEITKQRAIMAVALPADAPEKIKESLNALDEVKRYREMLKEFSEKTAHDPDAHTAWVGKRTARSFGARTGGLREKLFDDKTHKTKDTLNPNKTTNKDREEFEAKLPDDQQKALYKERVALFNVERRYFVLKHFADAYEKSFMLMHVEQQDHAQLQKALDELKNWHQTLQKEVADNRLNYAAETLSWLNVMEQSYTKLEREMEKTLKLGSPERMIVFQTGTSMVNEEEFKTWSKERNFNPGKGDMPAAAFKAIGSEPELALDKTATVHKRGETVTYAVSHEKAPIAMYEKWVKDVNGKSKLTETAITERQKESSDRHLLYEFLKDKKTNSGWKMYNPADGKEMTNDDLAAAIKKLPGSLSEERILETLQSAIHVTRPYKVHDDKAVFKSFDEYRHSKTFTTYNSQSIPSKETLEAAEVILSSLLRSGEKMQYSGNDKSLLFAITCYVRQNPEVFNSKVFLPPRDTISEPTPKQMQALAAYHKNVLGRPFEVRAAVMHKTPDRAVIHKAQERDKGDIKPDETPARRPRGAGG